MAEFRREGGVERLRRVAQRSQIQLRDLGQGRFHTERLTRDQQTLHARREPDAGDRLLEFGEQEFVAAAAGDGVLRAEAGVRELEDGVDVVVEAANEPRVDRELDALFRQEVADFLEVVAGFGAEELRRIGGGFDELSATC